MNASTRMRSAMGATFALHLLGVLLAGALALDIERSFSALGGHIVGGADALLEPGAAYLVEALAAWRRHHAPEFAKLLLVILSLALFLSPWLEMSWLAALDEPGRGLGPSLRLGAARYLRAIALFLLQALLSSPLLLLSGLAPIGVHLLLAESPFIPLHDLAVLAALLPSLVIALLAACWVDLGRLSLLPPGAGVLSAAKRSLLLLRPRIALAYVGWLSLGLCLILGANALSAASPPGLVNTAIALGAAQFLLFMRSLCRARWLAGALSAAAERR